ncbi:MAG: 50S ribosomal protein L30 [Fusobacteriota bacterium]
MAKEVKIKLVKSLIGRHPKHVRTLKSLGLTKIGKTVTKKATDDILGKTNQVSYMVEVEEV